jgi:hypothetical protein
MIVFAVYLVGVIFGFAIGFSIGRAEDEYDGGDMKEME